MTLALNPGMQNGSISLKQFNAAPELAVLAANAANGTTPGSSNGGNVSGAGSRSYAVASLVLFATGFAASLVI
jgi:hypothetical protein